MLTPSSFIADDQHRAGHGAAERRGVEIGDAAGARCGRRRTGSRRCLRAPVACGNRPAGLFRRRISMRLARNLVVVGLVGLAEIGGIGKDPGALLLHPQQRRAGVETARESDADFFPFGQAFQDRAHQTSNRSELLDVVGWLECANIKFRADGHAFNDGSRDEVAHRDGAGPASRPRQRCARR